MNVNEERDLQELILKFPYIANTIQKWRDEGYSDKEIREFIEILEAPD